jgi:hypothetical protein
VQLKIGFVAKAGNPPHEAIQKLSIDVRNYVCNVLASQYNAHGHFCASYFEAQKTSQKVLAAGQQWVAK